MKKEEADFLTHKQRVKFIGAVIPFITIFTIPFIAYSATNRSVVICMCFLPPIVGVTFLKLSTITNKELMFKLFPIIINGMITFFICCLSGPKSPSFLAGIPLIGACVLIFSNIRHTILAIIYVLILITLGSYLTGKEILDISTNFALLLCYSFIIVRMLQFSVLQGNEIISSQEKIKEQKRLIEEKQKDIIDSIHYAKRIQTTLLPSEKQIEKILDRSKKSRVF